MRRPGGRGLAGDESDDRLFHVLLYKLGGGFFGVAADFADHDDGFGFGIAVEQVERIDERCADDRISADADGGRLSDAALRELVDRFVGQRARARDDSDRSFFVDRCGHDADLAFAGRNDAGAIRADQARAAVLQKLPGLHHVERRNAFGDADDEIDSASAASMMASAANGGGTKITVAFAPVLSAASRTVLKIGQPSCVVPPLPGVTPPTIFVPYAALALAWKVPSRPVRPCTITRVFLSTRIAIFPL